MRRVFRLRFRPDCWERKEENKECWVIGRSEKSQSQAGWESLSKADACAGQKWPGSWERRPRRGGLGRMEAGVGPRSLQEETAPTPLLTTGPHESQFQQHVPPPL